MTRPFHALRDARLIFASNQKHSNQLLLLGAFFGPRRLPEWLQGKVLRGGDRLEPTSEQARLMLSLENMLSHELQTKLEWGKLVARGFVAGSPDLLDIPREWWRRARLDFQTDSASNHGVTFSGIVVAEAEAQPPSPALLPIAQQPDTRPIIQAIDKPASDADPATRPRNVKNRLGRPPSYDWLPFHHYVSQIMLDDGTNHTWASFRRAVMEWVTENMDPAPAQETIDRQLVTRVSPEQFGG